MEISRFTVRHVVAVLTLVLLANLFSFAWGITTVKIPAEAEETDEESEESRTIYVEMQNTGSDENEVIIKDRVKNDNFDRLSMEAQITVKNCRKYAPVMKSNMSESGCKVRHGLFYMKLQSDDDEHPCLT